MGAGTHRASGPTLVNVARQRAAQEMNRIRRLFLVCAVGLLCGCDAGHAPGSSLATAAATAATLTTNELPNATFPSQVANFPVISVARAISLLQSGELNGQAVAVGGYYDAFYPSCPYPGRYIGPLEAWCAVDAFTDARADAQLCQPLGSNGTSCRGPTGTSLSPFFMGETSGNPSKWLSGGATGKPAALVLVGHAGDPRQWQCTGATQGECSNAFVVDRIAWAEGHDVPLAAPETGDQQGRAITPRMTLGEVATAAGVSDDVVAGAAFKAGDVASIDPRWNFAGDNVEWVVRSVGLVDPSQSVESRAETAWLIDDASGRVIDSHLMKLDADYEPARLWQMATVHGLDCCAGDVTAFDRVSSGGSIVHEGMISGGSSGGLDFTTFGGGYGSGPLVLLPGRYSVSTWLATYAGGVAGTPHDSCSTQINLLPLGEVALNADFPGGLACTSGPAPLPSPGGP
jgi:hypothetical protein